MDDHADRAQLLGVDGGRLPGGDGRAPGQEFDGRRDLEQRDQQEDRQFGDEGVAGEIIGLALLEKEHPAQPDREQQAGGGAEHRVGLDEALGGGVRQVLA